MLEISIFQNYKKVLYLWLSLLLIRLVFGYLFIGLIWLQIHL